MSDMALGDGYSHHTRCCWSVPGSAFSLELPLLLGKCSVFAGSTLELSGDWERDKTLSDDVCNDSKT